jgi:hypothetical protein
MKKVAVNENPELSTTRKIRTFGSSGEVQGKAPRRRQTAQAPAPAEQRLA